MSDADDPEEDSFADAMQDVAPLAKGHKQIHKAVAVVTPSHLKRREAALGLNSDPVDPNFLTLAEVLPRAPLEVLEWKKDGVQNAVFDRMRKGGYAHQGILDLHRKTVKEARAEIFGFLKMAQASDWRNLLISPGKGEFSSTPGRLKSYLANWLEAHPEVIAFCSAQRRHGGVGAVYVLVRKSAASKELNREQYGIKSDFEDEYFEDK